MDIQGEIKVVLVDDHKLVLEGIRSLIEPEEDILIAGIARNGEAAVELVQICDPDVILMDIDMPKMNGIAAAKIILEQNPKAKIIILSMHEERAMIKNLLELGVKGYMLKKSEKKELLYGIRKVYEGGNAYSSDVLLALSKPKEGELEELTETGLAHEFLLTKREIEILTLIAEGYSNTEIGEKLFISPRTVDTHRTNMMKKLDVKNIAGLIKYAFKAGLVK